MEILESHIKKNDKNNLIAKKYYIMKKFKKLFYKLNKSIKFED